MDEGYNTTQNANDCFGDGADRTTADTRNGSYNRVEYIQNGSFLVKDEIFDFSTQGTLWIICFWGEGNFDGSRDSTRKAGDGGSGFFTISYLLFQFSSFPTIGKSVQ